LGLKFPSIFEYCILKFPPWGGHPFGVIATVTAARSKSFAATNPPFDTGGRF